MATKWTKEQQQVIDLRNRNILVSAAAGSGKTAVLVERIISMISDKNKPVDVDKLLIVTFTNAAAAEMRERIGDAIEKELEKHPEDVHLQRQVSLIHSSYIMTIDSFCKSVIQDNFNSINIDPSFRIGDEGELKLLKADVMESLLEEHYKADDTEFIDFVESYSSGKTDKDVEEMILQLHEFSISYPWPDKWLDNCNNAYEVSTLEELENTQWVRNLLENLKSLIEDLIYIMEKGINTSLEEDGPYMYETTLKEELVQLKYINEAVSYVEHEKRFRDLKFGRLSSKKDERVSDDKRSAIKAIRDTVKKNINSIKEKYFFAEAEEILSDIVNSKNAVNVLVKLTKEFDEKYKEAKVEKNILDFSDLEHYALNILCYEEEGKLHTTDAAKQLRDNFHEVMIDEYQDSNLVQEYILTSVSKCSEGINNIFMVGDVKQSIYKFRMARPELFMEKYEKYSSDDSNEQKIELHKNFRSRSQVLDSVNFIFYQIMGKDLGRVEYNEEAALNTGALFEECDTNNNYETEFIIIDEDSIKEVAGSDFTKRELEAKAIANRIKSLITQEQLEIVDKKTKQYRRCEYRDIVILLRTMSGWAETFTKILAEEGIPAHAGSKTGYFSAFEITTMLNYLRIIDNPIQDIPFAAVLTSPIYNFSPEEMAQVKGKNKGSIYENAKRYCENGDNEKLKSKLETFFNKLNKFRTIASYTEIHKLIWAILDETGFGSIISVMPGAEQRSANMEMLVQKAIAFEKTSYKGLFNFIRYIEGLQKFDIDFGEAEITNENDNAVKIMSIHKSKGLEFPIVFVSGMGKRFNDSDSKTTVIMHPDMGVGTDYINYSNRTKRATLVKRILQSQLVLENKGEELRVLYVALTRAKEKLILTGAVSKLEDKLKKLNESTYYDKRLLMYSDRQESSDYITLVMKSLARHKCFDNLYKEYGLMPYVLNKLHDEDINYKVSVYSINDSLENELINQTELIQSEEMLKQELKLEPVDENIKGVIESSMNYKYEYEESLSLHTKVSVSEVKKAAMQKDEEAWEIVKAIDEDEIVPSFIKEEQKVSGTSRGNAYHKVLELLDYKSLTIFENIPEEIEKQIARMVELNKLEKESQNIVYIPNIVRFINSNIGKRMIEADLRNELFKEKQFVMGVKAKDIYPSSTSSEIVLVQGIIDVFFIENNEITVVDYKTDKVISEEKLIEHYSIQLELYKNAIEKIYKMPVKDMFIYSFSLGKEIMCGVTKSIV